MDPQSLISALRGPQDPLFAVPPQRLQQMAGEVLYPPAGRFLPLDPAAPWVASERYEHAQTQPSGQKVLGGTAPHNVIPITPRRIDSYLR